eukprot:CAMPEP_0184377734 /NCGR_PEP_ID=MMETSP0007-20130409/2516_1 /TAXON_ID=97485 /ORGANISM="Prymnesium parvum, Strain Texoma1" /LENGTH=39 /DNA_ID= /DNA_START= /DNA_END= /DNA_ORIENTATION=
MRMAFQLSASNSIMWTWGLQIFSPVSDTLEYEGEYRPDR